MISWKLSYRNCFKYHILLQQVKSFPTRGYSISFAWFWELQELSLFSDAVRNFFYVNSSDSESARKKHLESTEYTSLSPFWKKRPLNIDIFGRWSRIYFAQGSKTQYPLILELWPPTALLWGYFPYPSKLKQLTLFN